MVLAKSMESLMEGNSVIRKMFMILAWEILLQRCPMK